jgi:hypothetical protein
MEIMSSAFATSTLSSTGSTSTVSTITTTPPSGIEISSNQSGVSPKGWQSWNLGAKAGCIVGTIIIFLAVLVLAITFITRRKRRLHALSSPIDDDRLYGSPPGTQVEVIAAGEPKTSLDSSGIRWPEGVMLTGDSQEIHGWTAEYDRDYRGRMSLSVASARVLQTNKELTQGSSGSNIPFGGIRRIEKNTNTGDTGDAGDSSGGDGNDGLVDLIITLVTGSGYNIM